MFNILLVLIATNSVVIDDAHIYGQADKPGFVFESQRPTFSCDEFEERDWSECMHAMYSDVTAGRTLIVNKEPEPEEFYPLAGTVALAGLATTGIGSAIFLFPYVAPSDAPPSSLAVTSLFGAGITLIGGGVTVMSINYLLNPELIPQR